MSKHPRIDKDHLPKAFARLVNPDRCPNFILGADHYRDDGSCKCNDPNDTTMAAMGYKWRKGQWR